MGSSRVFRLIEGSLVSLFFIQAARAAFAVLLALIDRALTAGQVDMDLVYSHIALVVALALGWFAPRRRKILPAMLSITSILVAVARVALSYPVPNIRLYASLAVIGFGSVYYASLLRANRRTWLATLVAGVILEQVIRAWDTYDLSFRGWVALPVSSVTLRLPWVIAVSLIMIVISRLARRSAPREPYEPAYLSVWGGLAIGGFFTLEVVVLGLPNVIARWTGVPYAGLVPWLLLATALPLMPYVREVMGQTLGLFDDRLRGWVWLFTFLLTIVVGGRLVGWGAAGALIVAQFAAVLSLWWAPNPPDVAEVEQVGPSLSLGLFTYILLVYVYSLVFTYNGDIEWLKEQGQMIVVLLAAGLLGLPRLLWREKDPWLEEAVVPQGVPLAFIAPIVVLGLILSGYEGEPAPVEPRDTFRIATYNVNGGYDANGVFQLELVARTIEASLADIVVLQEADTGRPISYGIDQVQYLARRLNMYQAYQPASGQVYGTAILSRWPIVDQNGVLLPVTEGALVAIRASLDDAVFGHPVTVIGAQFAPGENEDRLLQLEMLVSLIGETTFPVLAADLAASPNDVVYQQLTVSYGFLDPDVILGIERGYTTPAHNPKARHDYVLIEGLVPIDSRQVSSAASDHRLVVVEVGWP